ncbi:MAG TPA: putative toxin-antitoxin system toxin component, PIN family [Chloroflexia bacterium]|jgi:hypothetical protein
MIRVLLDANVYISYLLTRGATGTIAQLISAAVEGLYVLLLPEEILQEISEAMQRKKALVGRIKPEELQVLTSSLLNIAEEIEPIREKVPAVSRDPKDTYLLAYAVVGQADYLVTGDRDLLVLDPVGSLRIISPADFLSVLSEQSSP